MRFRLMVAIPVILTALSVASAVFVMQLGLNVIASYPYPFTALLQREVSREIRLWLPVVGLLSALAGILLAMGITRPIRHLIARTQKLAGRQRAPRARITAPDEIGLLQETFTQAVLSMDRYVQDSYILDNLPEAVMTLDGRGRLLALNSVAEHSLGVMAEAAEGRAYEELFPEGVENAQFRRLIRDALGGKRGYAEELGLLTAEKRWLMVEAVVTPLPDEGERWRVLVIWKDLAEAQRIRERIRQADQLASLGSLVAGLAHEVRNPLGAVRGLVELLADEREPERRALYLSKLKQTADRINTLMAELLEFAHPTTKGPEPRDINALVREALATARMARGDAAADVRERLAPDLPQVAVDGDRLVQAFVNLLTNAFEAASPGASVEVATALAPDHGGPQGSELLVTVHNTGSFIPPEIRRQIFVPFFTTKPQGTGLGLPIAYQIIQAHAGTIEVESSPADGTTFRVRLPLSGAPAAAAEMPPGSMAHG
ncbi:MAG: PAS domain-containing protein [Deltaproteobacteria bacterium]|nr:PAS domain-containing protein [Deltaproteobacteria bacterium]